MAKRALLVGLNSYPDPANDLRGCLNDVRAMRAVLVDHYCLDEARDLRILANAAATTRAIRVGLQWLVAGARAGDVLVFHYSGHGSQVPDLHGDEWADGLDEIICPYDLDWDRPFTDDDLHEIVKNLPAGAQLTVILDCCHAGTGLRETPPGRRFSPSRYRYLERPHPPVEPALRSASCHSTRRAPGQAVGPRALHRFGRRAAESGALLVAACRDDQVSADAFIEGDYHGALTFFLCRALAASGFAATYDELIREVRRELRLNEFEQVPQLEGPVAARRQAMFVASHVHAVA